MVSGASQPFSSWAMTSAAITADCFWSAGYLAISRSIFFCDSGDSMFLPVDLAKDDVLGPYDGHHVGQHVAFGHLVQRRQVREARRAYLQPVGLVGAVGHRIDAELTLGMLHRGVGLARRHVY